MSIYKKIISGQLPEIYKDDKETVNTKEINVISKTLDEAQKEVDSLEKELFIQTAEGIGLRRQEEIYKIDTDSNKPIEHRRSYVKSLMVSDDIPTPELVKRVAESYVNGQVEVLEVFNEYLVIIKFVGSYGIPPNLEDCKKVLRETIHGHLGLEYEFMYLLIKDIHDVMTLTEINNTKLNKFAGRREADG